MKKILIVDDDKAFRETMKVFLENKGYVVDTAVDGDEGYAKIMSVSPDLILLDIVMPNQNGIAVLDKIKKEDSVNHIPVVISSNYPGAEGLVKGLNANSFINKGNSSEQEILDKIEEIFLNSDIENKRS